MSQYLLAPDWLLADDGSQLTAIHVKEGSRVQARGELRERLLGRRAGALTASDRALGRLDPALGSLLAHRTSTIPVVATRASVLRGSGWSRLFVELTGRCNESCSHCYADAGPHVETALDLETIRRVIEDGAALGFSSVQLTGGDPLISPHVVDAARLAQRLGVPVIEVYTNGLALDPKLYADLAATGACFAFSVYSATPEGHDAVTRVPGSHARTSRAIRRAVEGGSEVRVGIISMDGDAEGARRTREYAASLGVAESGIGVDSQREVGRGVFAPESLVRRGSGGAPRAGSALARQDQEVEESHAAPRPPFSGTAAVAYDGRVHPCIFSRTTVLGDVRRQRLRDILEAPEPLASFGSESLTSQMADLTRHLTCWECRLRVSLLSGAPS